MTRKVHIFTLEAKVFVKRDGKPYPERSFQDAQFVKLPKKPTSWKVWQEASGMPCLLTKKTSSNAFFFCLSRKIHRDLVWVNHYLFIEEIQACL